MIRKKMLKRRPALIDVSVSTLERYYQDLIELETEMRDEYGDLGDGLGSPGYDLAREKMEVLRKIARLRTDELRPRSRL